MPEFVDQALVLAREGFAEVNAVQGLFVAVVATLMLTNWSRIGVIAGGAVVAHIALDVMAPVIAEVGGFQLPQVLEVEFWRYLVALFVGYLIVIGILFAIKRLVVKGS